MYSTFIYYLWPLLALLVNGTQFFSAFLLAKSNSPGSKIMIGGALMSLGGITASILFRFLFNQIFGTSAYASGIIWALTSLGSVAFAIGLLIHSLRIGADKKRIAELEAILAAQMNPLN